MKIKDFFPRIKTKKEIAELVVTGISDDSRLIKNGDIFFIKERENFDIFSILKAIEDKVAVFIAEDKTKGKIERLNIKKPIIFVKNINKYFQTAADRFYGFNKSNFTFIGIAGTKGKTTTAYLIYHLLRKLSQKVSLISTIEYLVGDRAYEARNTTPDYLTLRKIFNEIKDSGARFVVMEVSSHGIQQHRIEGIDFSRCVFTNLKREHLDYHKTMQSYFNVKKSFFTKNKRSTGIINIDDPYGIKIIRRLRKKISYGINSKASLCAKNMHFDKNGIRFELFSDKETFPVTTSILGRHNVYNILAAIGAVFSLGFPLRDIIKFITSFRGVEGRLEEIAPGIFVDYAHTADSLEKALSAVKDIGYEKVICVFGCGGNRDAGKRKIMGRVASKLADFTVITSDNPRGENPLSICAQIKKGFESRNYSIIADRKEAIREALKLKIKHANYCLLVAGKGHENCQIVGNKRIPFKDSNVIRELIKKC
ncbi:MAG: UDP-N-acetylmuramoyl-L-alanyl-D-glutamate--2,6-diaminopimelate ligase [Candidatus Omnitrophota bacterium]|nr:UDP-N-acetylmuramoyl-L-alanyl-D-glutamate--2,6-diaminopimelate ligase [Candidatus Omnitrophota bacterium]